MNQQPKTCCTHDCGPGRNCTMERRLVRIETRLAKFMAFFGLDPATGEPTPQTLRRMLDERRQENASGPSGGR